MASAAVSFGKDPRLQVRADRPFNAGPPLAAMREHAITPTELFFVRNHGDVPRIDPATYRLEVRGLVERPLSLTLDEVRRLGTVHLTATLQCAGNRRAEMAAARPIPDELPWQEEAISNAFWTGVPLARVLEAAGPRPGARHVAFTGLDEVERHGHRFGFGGSVPLDKAMGPEVLLAWEMNGAPLAPVHGAPLRVLVPGYIGARSVKWLAEVTVQEEPSGNYFQARAYKLYPKEMGPDDVDWSAGRMLEDMQLNSVICAPGRDETVRTGLLRVKGYAIAGGGRRVERVELSGDGGRSWNQAELFEDRGPWAWRFWRGSVGLLAGEHELVVRARDSAGQAQPTDPAEVWNFKGYMSNAWHRVRVRAV